MLHIYIINYVTISRSQINLQKLLPPDNLDLLYIVKWKRLKSKTVKATVLEMKQLHNYDNFLVQAVAWKKSDFI